MGLSGKQLNASSSRASRKRLPKRVARQSPVHKQQFRSRCLMSAEAQARAMCRSMVVHQFGLVDIKNRDYDSKKVRLVQLLERLPVGSGSVVVVAEQESIAAAQAAVNLYHKRTITARRRAEEATASQQKLAPADGIPVWPLHANQERQIAAPCRNLVRQDTCCDPRTRATCSRKCDEPHGGEFCPHYAGEHEKHMDAWVALEPPVRVDVAMAGHKAAETVGCGYRYVINYDFPSGARDYLQRLDLLLEGDTPGICYTFVEEQQLNERRCRDVVALMRRARRMVAKSERYGGVQRATEFDSQLLLLVQEEVADEDDDVVPGKQQKDAKEDVGHGPACDCNHCSGKSLASVSYHSGYQRMSFAAAQSPRVEVVHLPWRALQNLTMAAPLVAPRLPDHNFTVICLHNMNCHTPWDGWEHLFALPQGMGSVRVVMALADGGSWHDYPDIGSFSGGVPWIDILDPSSMMKTDMLIERLVEHEASLLDGQSERIVLLGMSQGGGQSMLRFLRSSRPLGGWIGAVCHAPIAPHMPREFDPLLAMERPTLNCGRPMRFLAGEVDTIFPASLAIRDAERLRDVGGFTDVKVKIEPGLKHDGYAGSEQETWPPPPELLFVQKQLPAMLKAIRSPKLSHS
eukprot:gnl/TRDRNA2_/TRDRNA2_167427_c0_seq1.p1 gnl/TRDRNA2_/TRDRNA2_167427_c0~~gnl/TRDRNA2_/TRDRNA2_167427_c0_seq1.p1  ORF type:complete len:630 (+),score=102.12 gnl/TRDRNA2_/TRDRNA2_167427_c0_seq1:46-1935(+)